MSIDASNGLLRLADRVTLEGGMNARQLRTTTLVSALRPVVMNPPFATLRAEASLDDGIPVIMTLVFAYERLAQVSFRFRYPAEVDERQVHEQHALWLARVLGDARVFEWGTVGCEYDPRNDEANVVITWRGVSDLYDGAMPPPPSMAEG